MPTGNARCAPAARPDPRSLGNGTSGGGEGVVGIAADEANRGHHQHQNDRKHHRVFGDILALFVDPELFEEVRHGGGLWVVTLSDFGCEDPRHSLARAICSAVCARFRPLSMRPTSLAITLVTAEIMPENDRRGTLRHRTHQIELTWPPATVRDRPALPRYDLADSP